MCLDSSQVLYILAIHSIKYAHKGELCFKVSESLCLYVSVYLFFCPSVLLQVKVFRFKFLVKGVYDEVGSPINLKLSTHFQYDMIFLILMPN